MQIARTDFEEERGAVLVARWPERLDDEQRRRKYDEPLRAMMRKEGPEILFRGFSEVGEDGEVPCVRFELTFAVMKHGAWFAKRLMELGAPREGRVEIETEKASLEMSLADVAQ